MGGKPKQPPIQQAPPAPAVDDARVKIDERSARASRQGRAASLLVKEETPVSTQTKQLTGN